jgi:hypothetical protein
MEDDPHLAVMRQWMTAAELDVLRKEHGSAADMVAHKRKVDRIVQKAEHREAIWNFLKTILLAFVAIIGALATIKAIIPLEWLQ